MNSIYSSPRSRIKVDSIGTFASLLPVLYPFFIYYGYGSVSVSFLLATLVFIYTLVKRGSISFEYPIAMVVYMLYFCLARVFFNLDSLHGMFSLGIVFVFLLNGFLNREVVLCYFLRFYRYIIYINIAFFFIQECLYYVLGYRIIGIMTFLPLRLGDGDFDTSQYLESASVATRSSAFFSEPAHFVHFLLPLLVLELFYVQNRQAYLRSCLYLAVLLALASGNALLGVGIVGLFFILKILKRFHLGVAILFVSLFIAFSVLSVNYMLTTEYGQKMLERSEELDSDQAQVSSGFIRIFRGYYIWDEMDSIEKIFGLNSTSKLDDKIKQSAVALTFREGERYMNAVKSCLIYTGYIGTFIFIGLLIYLWHGNNLAGKCCLIIYVSLCFISSVYFTQTMVLYLLIALLMKRSVSGCKLQVLKIKLFHKI